MWIFVKNEILKMWIFRYIEDFCPSVNMYSFFKKTQRQNIKSKIIFFISVPKSNNFSRHSVELNIAFQLHYQFEAWKNIPKSIVHFPPESGTVGIEFVGCPSAKTLYWPCEWISKRTWSCALGIWLWQCVCTRRNGPFHSHQEFQWKYHRNFRKL